MSAGSEGDSVRKKARYSDLFAALRDTSNRRSVSDQQADFSELSCNAELNKYKTFVVQMSEDNNPLVFWQKHQNEFPIMAETARRVLCISASSAQSERDFSSVGRTITDTRSMLSPSKVEAIQIVREGLRSNPTN
jgi:hypothetical protein